MKLNKPQLVFLAEMTADIDWQEVGHNENPYNKNRNPIQHKAYDDRFEQIAEEWDQAFGGVA